MKCSKCKVNKLSKEFPPVPITEACDHYPMWCLRCTVAYCKEKQECPECNNIFTDENSKIPWFEAILDKMFPKFHTNYTPTAPSPVEPRGVIKVIMLNGNSKQYIYKKDQTILDLKRKLKEDWKVEIDKQKLIHNQRELKIYRDKHEENTLEHLEVQQNATIHMHVLLHTVSDDLKKLVFEMSWEFPPSFKRTFFSFINKMIPTDMHRDYIDATCFMFKKKECPAKCIVDFSQKKSPCKTVVHGDTKIDDINLTGKQTIRVDLSKVSQEYSYLFFTLSARKSPTISIFPKKMVKFYEESKPEEMLGCASFTDLSTSKAAIMCYLTRDDNGHWQVYQSGKTSGGNVSCYDPLIDTIRAQIINV